MSRPSCLCPFEGYKHGVSIQSSIKLAGTLLRIACKWKTAGTWFLARLFILLSAITSQILEIIYWTVMIFSFDQMTGENQELLLEPIKLWLFKWKLQASLISMNWDSLRVRTHWTDKICLALPKFSTKFASAKFSICQVWEHWDTAKYLFTTSFNHTEINIIACSLFAGKVTWDLTRHGLTVIFNRFDRIYYCLCSSCFLPWIRLNPAEAVATSTMPVEASPCSTATFWS